MINLGNLVALAFQVFFTVRINIKLVPEPFAHAVNTFIVISPILFNLQLHPYGEVSSKLQNLQ